MIRVAFIHPTLGLGGAERLIVDAAQGLSERGHRVTIFTTRHDRERSFVEADARFEVRVIESRIPESCGGRLRAPLMLARMGRLAKKLRGERGNFDVAVCDLTPHVIPGIGEALGVPVAAYCHYPDLLLAPRRRGLYAVYRRPIDRAEEKGLAAAARVWVNSRFTAEAYRETFPALPAPSVLYPGVDTELYANVPPLRPDADLVFLSINRFAPAKNLGLAIDAFCLLPAGLRERARLVIAGGYDPAAPDSRAVLEGLRRRAAEKGVGERVDFVLNPSEPERLELLTRCLCLVYTPSGEHFGLGPVEAMAAGRPVLAVAGGGPLETVIDGETGFLTAATPEAFASALQSLAAAPARLGEQAREHARNRFSRSRFAASLEEDLPAMADSASKQRPNGEGE